MDGIGVFETLLLVHQEVGAARLKNLELSGRSISSAGEFYPIYHVENGVLIQHSPPPQA